MIKMTTHASERRVRYGLAQSWIEITVSSPDWTRIDPTQPGVTRSFKSITERADRILRVVHRPEGADVLVLTAFFDRGAKP